MESEFVFVEIEDIPFKIDSATLDPVSRLRASEDGTSVVEIPLTESDRRLYWDMAEDNANAIAFEEAVSLALSLR